MGDGLFFALSHTATRSSSAALERARCSRSAIAIELFPRDALERWDHLTLDLVDDVTPHLGRDVPSFADTERAA